MANKFNQSMCAHKRVKALCMPIAGRVKSVKIKNAVQLVLEASSRSMLGWIF